MARNSQQVCLSVPIHLVARIDALVDAYKQDAREARYGPLGAFNITRNAVIRQAVAVGLSHLEEARKPEATSLGDQDDAMKVGQ